MSTLSLLRMRLSSTSTSSPGRLSTFDFPQQENESYYHLIAPPGEDVRYIEASEDVMKPPADAIAVMICREGGALLAALVDGCSVTTALRSLKTLPLKKSVPGDRYLLNLRPGDNILFDQQSFRCVITEVTPQDALSPRERLFNLTYATKSVRPTSPDPETGNGSQSVSVFDIRPFGGTAVPQPHSPVRPASKEEPQIYSTAREGSSESRQPLKRESSHSPTKRITKTQQQNGHQHELGSAQQVLETPIKHKALPDEHNVKTPTLLKLEAADKEHPAVLERRQPMSDAIQVSRITPDLPTQVSTASTESLASTGKLKRVRKQAKVEDTAMDQPKPKRARRVPDSKPSTIPTQPVTARKVKKAVPSAGGTILMSKSMYKDDKDMVEWLTQQDYNIAADVPDDASSYVCVVGNEPLSRTGKLLRSLARGQPVVSDQWLTDSRERDQLLDHSDYQHDDLAIFSDNDRISLLAGKHVFITSNLQASLKNGYKDFAALLTDLGALTVDHGTARKLRDQQPGDNVAFIGAGSDDAQAQQIAEMLGCRVLSKEVLVESVIRGTLLTEDEAVEVESAPPPSTARKGRKK